MIAGLDLDFRGEPFGPMPLLLALAERVDKLNAICVVCGAPASRTQRLVDGVPTRYDDPIIMVGGSESYEARSVEPAMMCQGSRQNISAMSSQA